MGLAPQGAAQTQPPTNSPPLLYIWSPTNGASFLAVTNLIIYVRAIATTGTLSTIEYFTNNHSLGVLTNGPGVLVTNVAPEPLFPMPWSNVVAGSYALKAIATDSRGAMGTSSVVTISVVTNLPVVRPVVYIYSPTNGASFLAPTNLTLYARGYESTGSVRTVQFFAGTNSLGVVSNSNQVIVTNLSSEPLFPLSWSPALVAGSYALKAVATDAAGITGTSSVVTISVVTNLPVVRPVVYIYSPTNGASFLAPTNLTLYARGYESAGSVRTVQFFAGTNSLGVVSNSNQVIVTNLSSEPLFPLSWSPALVAGSYALKAVATDAAGITGTSSVVTISVVTNLPVVRPAVYIYSPANGASFLAPTNLTLYARGYESTGTVQTVQFFAGTNSLGVVSNSSQVVVTNLSSEPLFPLPWSPALAGSYALKAVATDAAGITGTSSVVTISVVTNLPVVRPAVYIYSPANGASFLAPTNLTLYARGYESTGTVQTVQFFAGTNSLGVVSNSNQIVVTNLSSAPLFPLAWSPTLAGSYALKAVATDAAGITGTSSVVTISVVTNLPPPVVSLYAPDPVAVEGTNQDYWFTPPTTFTNYIGGTNTATFLVLRDGPTNNGLTVSYSIGGSASNGVDYAAIPNQVTIPPGQRYALITILPLADNDSSSRPYDTVVLGLTVPPVPTNTPPPYVLGSPTNAAAIILEENYLPISGPSAKAVAGSSLHVSLPGTNGFNFCLQISTNAVDWMPMLTNTVIKGSAQHVVPDTTLQPLLFYRVVPAAGPPAY